MFVNVVDQDPLDRLHGGHGGHVCEPRPQTRHMTGTVRPLGNARLGTPRIGSPVPVRPPLLSVVGSYQREVMSHDAP